MSNIAPSIQQTLALTMYCEVGDCFKSKSDLSKLAQQSFGAFSSFLLSKEKNVNVTDGIV